MPGPALPAVDTGHRARLRRPDQRRGVRAGRLRRSSLRRRQQSVHRHPGLEDRRRGEPAVPLDAGPDGRGGARQAQPGGHVDVPLQGRAVRRHRHPAWRLRPGVQDGARGGRADPDRCRGSLGADRRPGAPHTAGRRAAGQRPRAGVRQPVQRLHLVHGRVRRLPVRRHLRLQHLPVVDRSGPRAARRAHPDASDRAPEDRRARGRFRSVAQPGRRALVRGQPRRVRQPVQLRRAHAARQQVRSDRGNRQSVRPRGGGPDGHRLDLRAEPAGRPRDLDGTTGLRGGIVRRRPVGRGRQCALRPGHVRAPAAALGRVSQLQPLLELRLLAGGDAQPEGSLRESDGTSARLPAGAPRLDSRRRVRPGRHVALPVAFFRSAERHRDQHLGEADRNLPRHRPGLRLPPDGRDESRFRGRELRSRGLRRGGVPFPHAGALPARGVPCSQARGPSRAHRHAVHAGRGEQESRARSAEPRRRAGRVPRPAPARRVRGGAGRRRHRRMLPALQRSLHPLRADEVPGRRARTRRVQRRDGEPAGDSPERALVPARRGAQAVDPRRQGTDDHDGKTDAGGAPASLAGGSHEA